MSNTEDAIRKRAMRAGFRLIKSRERKHVPNIDNHGGYMLTDNRNGVVLGSRFDATLDVIDAWLRDVTSVSVATFVVIMLLATTWGGSANAYTCHTTCNTFGNQTICHQNCY